MKYVIDIDALMECLDCMNTLYFNSKPYIKMETLKEFIQKFPKDKVNSTYTEYQVEKEVKQ